MSLENTRLGGPGAPLPKSRPFVRPAIEPMDDFKYDQEIDQVYENITTADPNLKLRHAIQLTVKEMVRRRTKYLQETSAPEDSAWRLKKDIQATRAELEQTKSFPELRFRLQKRWLREPVIHLEVKAWVSVPVWWLPGYEEKRLSWRPASECEVIRLHGETAWAKNLTFTSLKRWLKPDATVVYTMYNTSFDMWVKPSPSQINLLRRHYAWTLPPLVKD